MDGKGGVGGALRDLLRSQPSYKSLYAIAKARDENFRLYSLRHGYSVRGTSRNIDSGSMSDSMGNSKRTHEEAYQQSSKRTRRTAFAKANELLETKQ